MNRSIKTDNDISESTKLGYCPLTEMVGFGSLF